MNSEERSHAVLSPSAASRWLACTPSARLEELEPAETSTAAEEGTVAHALAEVYLRKFFGQISPADYESKLAEIRATEYYNDAMNEYAQNFRDYVIEAYNDAEMNSRGAHVFIEQTVDLTEYVPEGYGHLDTAICSDGLLSIIDFKYGKGVKVDAVDNRQLMLYALGAYLKFSVMYDFEVVRMAIFQPRIDNIVSHEIHAEELLKWAETELKPTARKAWEGVGELKVGPHCTFCKVKARCRAQAERALSLEKNLDRQAELLTPEEIADVLSKVDDLVSWAKAVSDYALSQALKGTNWPGFKVVAGRSRRQFTDTEAVIAAGEAAGLTRDQLVNYKLKGITEIEQTVGRKRFNEIFKDLIIKPEGAPTLVPLSDSRHVYGSAAYDFAGVEVPAN